MFKIVNTDNFNGDYPDEFFLNLPPMTEAVAREIAEVINRRLGGEYASRYYRVVDEDYVLQPGFEP